MSSIYRKGRDGYFYYQTYLKNPETGKKDKKIYVSLRTKDQKEATKKKGELDLKYAKLEKTYQSRVNAFYVKNKTIGYVIIAIIVTVFGTRQSLKKPTYEKSPLKELGTKNTHNAVIENLVQNSQDPERNDKSDDIIILKDLDLSNSAVNDLSSSLDSEKNELKSELKKVEMIPSYTIERIEYLSSAFKQVRIFLTIDEKSNGNSLRALCREIAKNHSEYSNILICLYKDSFVGKKLANGDSSFEINDNQEYDAWIAMYTYNDVEGEYFDDKPTSHLRSY